VTLTSIIIIPIYFFLGLGVKYIDAAHDDNTFSKKHSIPLAIALGTLAGGVMVWDQPTLIIFVSLILGVAITGKLDILPFQLLTAIAVLIPICYYSGSLPLGSGGWRLVLLISFGAAIDEFGNDLADAGFFRHVLRVFFLYRGYLKVLIGGIALLNYLRLSYVLAFLSFDLGYLLITRLSERRVELMVYDSTVLAR
jgi:hypothetical protein